MVYRRWQRICTIAVAMVLLQGCATLINTEMQPVRVTSTPKGSCVSINDVQYGPTPVIADLHRGVPYTVKIERAGTRPHEHLIVPVMSPWALGNILLGGVIGLAVDSHTKAMYDHSDDRVHATFSESHRSMQCYKDTVARVWAPPSHCPPSLCPKEGGE